jgi:hypothetical protein
MDLVSPRECCPPPHLGSTPETQLRLTPLLAPGPLQSEALLRSGLRWERSRRRAGWRVP